MNTYRYSEEQRKQWVKDKFSREKTVREICHEASISRATLYNWIEEFKHLEEEFKRKKNAVSSVKTSKPELLQKTTADAAEKYRMLLVALASIDSEKIFSKKLVTVLIKRFTLTVAQACAVVGIDETTYGYKPRKPEVEDYIVYEGLIELIREDRTREFEVCYNILRERNPDWTRKQIKRVYRDGMVYLERKRSNVRWQNLKKSKAVSEKESFQEKAIAANRIKSGNGTWNLALLEHSSELDGVKQSWWMLCITEEETKASLNASYGFGKITTEQILLFLDKAATENGVARKMKIPGKPTLTAREVMRWAWQHKMALHTFSLNKPENVLAIEAMEQAILNDLAIEKFSSTKQLETAIENWIDKAENTTQNGA
ncbi:MAG TPA: transposase [Flavipsychrobacter sp.]|nr:transposase [Flavipsychrobacter sp.]